MEKNPDEPSPEQPIRQPRRIVFKLPEIRAKRDVIHLDTLAGGIADAIAAEPFACRIDEPVHRESTRRRKTPSGERWPDPGDGDVR